MRHLSRLVSIVTLLGLVGCIALRNGIRQARQDCTGACTAAAAMVVNAIHEGGDAWALSLPTAVGCVVCVEEAIRAHIHDHELAPDAGAGPALPSPEVTRAVVAVEVLHALAAPDAGAADAGAP